jgi:histidinol-phosphatase (PHP family)
MMGKIMLDNQIYLANYHTHCHFCHGEGSPLEYVEEALKKGFQAIGFSCHIPLPFQNSWAMKARDVPCYIETIQRLKKAYAGKINVYVSMEIDYLRGEVLSSYNSVILDKLDYVIGAVHCFKMHETGEYLNISGDEKRFQKILIGSFHGSVKELVMCYYSTVKDMVRTYKPDIAAHLDLIKKNNAGGLFFSEEEKWYRDEVMKTLETLINYKCAVELNTGGMVRAGMDTYYPSKWILQECKKLKIPVVLNSDCHRPDQLDSFFEHAIQDLNDIGYRHTDFQSMYWLP